MRRQPVQDARGHLLAGRRLPREQNVMPARPSCPELLAQIPRNRTLSNHAVGIGLTKPEAEHGRIVAQGRHRPALLDKRDRRVLEHQRAPDACCAPGHRLPVVKQPALPDALDTHLARARRSECQLLPGNVPCLDLRDGRGKRRARGSTYMPEVPYFHWRTMSQSRAAAQLFHSVEGRAAR